MAGLNERILKVTGMFGGLQVVNILCSLVRSKLVALWIGAAGVGLFGIFNSALEMINSLAQLGIRQSAVRDIASAPREQVPVIVTVVRRWSLILGVAGMLFTLILSPWLSDISFGTTDYWWGFAALSAAVLLSSLNNGEGAVFQGVRSFRKLAVCSMLGAAGGFAVSVPMFYWWRIDSVVPSILAYTVVTWVAMGYYRENVPHPAQPVTLRNTFTLGRKFLVLGIYMTVTAVVTNVISYAFMAYLNHAGNLSTTGYYNAGFTLVNRYVGLVFSAIAMEYFPRLSAVVSSRVRTGKFVTNQLYISVTMIVPVSLAFVTCSELAVKLLYTDDFMVIIPFITWASLGTVFRAVSWCMAFVILARGDGRAFLFTELTSGTISICLNILFFNLWGFAGLGYAYVLWYGLYALIVAFVYFRRYGLAVERRFAMYLLYCLGVISAGAVTALNFAPFAAAIFALPASIVSFMVLRKLLKMQRRVK